MATPESELPEIEVVRIESLVVADSPRLSGENKEHINRLIEVGHEALPPILVQRNTMKVIDGVHRVRAAALAGQDKIAARFFEGGDDEAFLYAVKENTTHGLPLTLADRRAAAGRVMRTHPQLSDRSISEYTALSDKTVASIRRSTAEN